MDKVTFVTVHNSIDRTGRDTRAIEHGMTLEEMRTLYLPAAVDFSLSVNGRTMDDLTVVPRAGDMVVAVPVLAGGGDGKMIGRLIAMVVVAVVAWYAAPALVGAMGGSFTAAGAAATAGTSLAVGMMTGAIMMVGGLLVNMAFGSGGPGALQTFGNDANSSPTYSWSPQTTQQQGTVIPRFYGRNRLYGNIIVANIIYVGNNSYINTLISLGFGPFSAVVSHKINDQPIENFTGVQTPDVRLGYLDQPLISDVTDTAVEYPTSQIATHSTPAIYTTQGDSFDVLEIVIQFPSGLGEYTLTGTIIAQSVEYAVYISPHGLDQWENLSVDGMPSFRTMNGWSIGKWIYVSDLLPHVWAILDVPIDADAYYYAWSNNTLDTYGLEIIQSGMPFNAPDATGDRYTLNSSGTGGVDLYPAVIGASGLVWQYFSNEQVRVTDISSAVTSQTATGAQNSVLHFAKRISVSTHGRYDIKLERITADFTNPRQMGDMYLATVKEVTQQSFTYPRQVLVGLKALATNQLSGSLRYSCIADCSLLRVWDGAAWSVVYGTNPAWVCYDVLTQPIYDNALAVVRYDGIDPSRIDHAMFKEWADYCDELMDDGAGGTEKRIEFNGGFDSEMSLWEAVLRICGTAYATPLWNGIKLTVAIDRPADPVQLFSLGNIDQDSFKESFLPMSDRAAEIEVDFVNEENNYQRDKLSVINTAISNVTSKVSMNMFGVTKPSMCWRAAMRKLAYNQHITRTIEFGADIDAIACTVGDVILVQHDVPQWGYGGRVVSATTTEITVDQTIALEVGVSYAILVRLSDDSLVERDITNTPGDATVLTVSPAFSVAPAQFDVFTVGEILTTAKPFRVSNISRSSDLKAQISAVEYVAAVYDAEAGLPTSSALDYSQPLSAYRQSLPPFEAIGGMAVVESLRRYPSGLVDTIATIHWTPAANRYAFPSVEVWAWQDNVPPQKISSTPISSDAMEWIVPVDGLYWNFAIACVNLNGEAQSVNNALPVRQFIYGKTTAPADVTDMAATPVITGGVRLQWAAVADLDLQEYLIKYSPLTVGASWFGASVLLRTAATYCNIPVAQTGTYFVKAIDTTGHESINADSAVVASTPSIIGLTSYALIEEAPAWGGSIVNFAEVADELKVTDNTASASYTAGTEVDFGAVRTARVTARIDWHVNAMGGDLDAVTNLDEVIGWDGETGQSDVQAFIYTSQDSSAPTVKQPLFAGDYTFQRAKFTLEAYPQQPDEVVVSTFTINVDDHDTLVTI